MFLTLLHEYGHFLTFRDYIYKHNICPYEYGRNILKRELGAYYHGWKYIKCNSIKITKKAWKELQRVANLWVCKNGAYTLLSLSCIITFLLALS